MTNHECKIKLKTLLLGLAYYYIIFGTDSKSIKCVVQIETWMRVMNLLLINHLFGSPFNPEDCTFSKYFLGFLGINVTTLFWTIKGINELSSINSSSLPECINYQTKRSIIVDIIIGMMFSFPFILFLVIFFTSCLLAPIYIFLRHWYGPEFYERVPILRNILNLLRNIGNLNQI